MGTSAAIVIPARLNSQRLPRKPLLSLGGKPLIQHVWERAASCKVDEVAVATDSPEIAQVVRGFGGKAILTSPDCRSGSDRVAEAAAQVKGDILVNLQGDEPFVEPRQVQDILSAFADPAVGMATLKRSLLPGEAQSPQVVKVVTDRQGDAMYFSRSSIPFVRNGAAGAELWAHVGIYAYHRTFLAAYAKLSPTPLEAAESLEQLRVLEHGLALRVVATEYRGFGIDTPEDLERARQML